jgi:hypothetical protein
MKCSVLVLDLVKVAVVQEVKLRRRGVHSGIKLNLAVLICGCQDNKYDRKNLSGGFVEIVIITTYMLSWFL